jgi:histidinol-phosphate aminotransferase
VTHERVPAKQIFEALKAQQIYVRYFAQPRLENYLRVTVGTDAEMDELFAFLEKYLKENA